MVVGDMIADIYLEGTISRVSREAPVLVLAYAGETMVPGGGANVVHNVAVLAGYVNAAGVIGEDAAGRELVALLKDKHTDTTGLIIDPARPTITKTRITAGGQATVRQQVVRIDRESQALLDKEIEDLLLAHIQNSIVDMDGVILSDYGCRVITPQIIEHTIERCKAMDIPCIVDSRYNVLNFKGATIIKQNEAEAAAAVGIDIKDKKSLLAAGQELEKRLTARAVLITRGAQGMTLFGEAGTVTHIPVTNISEVYDVSGAGDTVVAVMALALAAGAAVADAARLANAAAGVVVRKLGTATAKPEELKNAVRQYYGSGRSNSEGIEYL
ncbi:bifunctional heptose 7-phosphate kinase/heptose 1-phosphate adenyltransferase [Methylomusa anaerophila]